MVIHIQTTGAHDGRECTFPGASKRNSRVQSWPVVKKEEKPLRITRFLARNHVTMRVCLKHRISLGGFFNVDHPFTANVEGKFKSSGQGQFRLHGFWSCNGGSGAFPGRFSSPGTGGASLLFSLSNVIQRPRAVMEQRTAAGRPLA